MDPARILCRGFNADFGLIMPEFLDGRKVVPDDADDDDAVTDPSDRRKR